MGTGSFPGVKRPGRRADPHPHLQCRGLKQGRAIPLPTLRALVAYTFTLLMQFFFVSSYCLLVFFFYMHYFPAVILCMSSLFLLLASCLLIRHFNKNKRKELTSESMRDRVCYVPKKTAATRT